MQIASVKAEYDLAARSIENGALHVVDPFALEAPFVQSEGIRRNIILLRAHSKSAGRSKVLGASKSNVSLRRSNLVHLSGCFNAFPMDADGYSGQSFCISFLKELLNPVFRLSILALAEMLESHL